MRNLIGKKCKIISDNECYSNYLCKELIITDAANEGHYYDSSMYPEMLCDLKTLDGDYVPFSLYEYEFELL